MTDCTCNSRTDAHRGDCPVLVAPVAVHTETPVAFQITGSGNHWIVTWKRAGSNGKITNHGPRGEGWPSYSAAVHAVTVWAAGFGVTITGWDHSGGSSYARVKLP